MWCNDRAPAGSSGPVLAGASGPALNGQVCLAAPLIMGAASLGCVLHLTICWHMDASRSVSAAAYTAYTAACEEKEVCPGLAMYRGPVFYHDCFLLGLCSCMHLVRLIHWVCAWRTHCDTMAPHSLYRGWVLHALAHMHGVVAPVLKLDCPACSLECTDCFALLCFGRIANKAQFACSL